MAETNQKKKDRSGGRKAGDSRPCRKCGATFTLTASQAAWGEGRCAECRGKANRADFEKHREKRREKNRKWNDANRPKLAKQLAGQRERYFAKHGREKQNARQRVYDAIKRGSLVRGACEKCATTQGVTAHHEDYSKPLEVRWLCRPCHGREHRSAA